MCIYVHMCAGCINIYISLSLSLSLYIYIYIYIYILSLCIYVHDVHLPLSLSLYVSIYICICVNVYIVITQLFVRCRALRRSTFGVVYGIDVCLYIHIHTHVTYLWTLALWQRMTNEYSSQ